MKKPSGPKDGLIPSRDAKSAVHIARWHRAQRRGSLELFLRTWKACVVFSEGEPCSVLFNPPVGRSIEIARSERVPVTFDRKKLESELSVENLHIFRTLLNELVKQSTVAMLAVPLAKAEMAAQRQRIDGAKKGGKASEKKSRATVKRRIQARIRQKLNPKDLFPEFVRDFGYTRRQLLNILEEVAGTP